MRIAKFVASRSIYSRRQIEFLIDEGSVLVNGSLVKSPVCFVSEDDEIVVKGKPITKVLSSFELFVYYKKAGLIVSKDDPLKRESVFDQKPFSEKKGILNTVGRLDFNTEGVLLFTNSGPFINYMSHPRNQIVRKYRVRIFGTFDDTKMELLQKGFKTESGVICKPSKIELDSVSKNNFWVNLWLKTGQNRAIHRIVENAGMKVNRLIRTDFGPFSINDMNPGDHKFLTKKQCLSKLRSMDDAPDNIEKIAFD
jgi:23S rRNA pseudouridine2605 synthase